jgi:hypothetical protein
MEGDGLPPLRVCLEALMNPPLVVQDPLVLSYLSLRRAVGLIGIVLPFVLALGEFLLDDWGLRGSVSNYYYSSMGDVFVGSMCAIAVFLFSYRGYERRDDVAGNLACIFALGVALFPAEPEAGATARQNVIGALHLFFAAGLLLTLAYFSLALFRLTSPHPTPQKLQRNRVYTVCGYIILACVALCAAVKLLPGNALLLTYSPVFWLEAVAIVAFGVSWLIKGEAILADK